LKHIPNRHNKRQKNYQSNSSDKRVSGTAKEKKTRDAFSKRREDLNLLSSPFTIAMLGVFFVSSTGLLFCGLL
jgi:hypothetical protein